MTTILKTRFSKLILVNVVSLTITLLIIYLISIPFKAKYNSDLCLLPDPEKQKAEHHLVLFLDPSCPGCLGAYKLAENLLKDYPERLSVDYKIYFTQENGLSKVVMGALSAAEENKVLEKYMDVLLINNQYWTKLVATDSLQDSLSAYAQQVGLDREIFKRGLQEGNLSTKLSNDQRCALNVGVYYVPAFFLDGRVITHNGDLDSVVVKLKSSL